MNVAVIGWGSLIWCPGSLRIRTRWHRDGPRLPIEFARISGDGRLTLVIHPGCEEQTTYWALSEYGDVGPAIQNLKEREGCSTERMASMRTDDESGEDAIKVEIKEWLRNKTEVDAAVWTNLRSNWHDKRCQEFNVEAAVRYLEQLEQHQQEAVELLKRTRDYVRNAPEQIQTKVRERIRERTGWADNKLADTLFEPN